MKAPPIKVAIKMPMPAAGRALGAGRAVLAQFAHHPPTREAASPERMKRPGHAHGPHN